MDVLEGGGAISPIELARVTKREARAGTRLACQVTIKQDIAVRVPDEILDVEQRECRVRLNDSVTPMIKELVLELPAGEQMDFRSGSYVQITAPTSQSAIFRIRHSSALPGGLGSARPLAIDVDVDQRRNPGLLHGELSSRRRGCHYTRRQAGPAAARSPGRCAARYRIVLHVLHSCPATRSWLRGPLAISLLPTRKTK